MSSRRGLVVLLVISVLVGFTAFPPEVKASDTSTRWQQVSESSACGAPYKKAPYADKMGAFAESQPILGPFGTYFGRTVSEVRSRLVWWQVPYSGGKRVQVHEEALPAFNNVAQLLELNAASGRVYPIKTVSGFYPRTIGGSYQISRHTLGTAIDMNYAENPYRSDGALITDMPQWFVDVWRDAGFCWGGDWPFSKDPMHFSWMGPGSAATIEPLPPRTLLQQFGSPSEAWPTVVAPVLDRYSLLFGDGMGNGAPDVLGLRAHPDGAVLDMASGSEGYGKCSTRRWFMEDQSFLAADHILMTDIDGDSGEDLVAIVEGGSGVIVRVAARRQDFGDSQEIVTALPQGVAAATGADFDGDHVADLWVTTDDGSLTIVGGPTLGTVLHQSKLPSGPPAQIAAGDRDGGDTPELFALYPTSNGSRLEILRLESGWTVEQSLALPTPASAILAVAALDYDGDGRADFESLDANGVLEARVGNTTTGQSPSSWFVNPDPGCDSPVLLDFNGAFFDDDGSVHETNIEIIASKGITKGCNPPFNDRYCPDSILTRAQAATFIDRSLGPPTSQIDYFTDDDGLVLEAGINRIAEAGITKGCNSPANDRFCPDRSVTRAEFAAFLARALSLPPTNSDYFIDDDGHGLEEAINRLAAVGITKGCNPPENDRFCPDEYLNRAQSASFMARAFN